MKTKCINQHTQLKYLFLGNLQLSLLGLCDAWRQTVQAQSWQSQEKLGENLCPESFTFTAALQTKHSLHQTAATSRKPQTTQLKKAWNDTENTTWKHLLTSESLCEFGTLCHLLSMPEACFSAFSPPEMDDLMLAFIVCDMQWTCDPVVIRPFQGALKIRFCLFPVQAFKYGQRSLKETA